MRDLLEPSDIAVLVVPIDKAAPKGRLILPQQQTIRDILEADAVSIVVKENELKNILPELQKKTKAGYHGQSGVRKSGVRYTRRHFTHIFFYLVRKI